MDELIVFPDAVDMVVEAISTALALPRPDVAVHAQVPKPRPVRLVTVERVGGTRRNLVVDDAMVSIEAWSPRADDAHSILQMARAVVYRMVGKLTLGVMTYRIDEVGGVQHSPDPVSGEERYIMTLQVSVRGSAVEFLSAQASVAGHGGSTV